jgi:hypothetical protein
MFLKRTSPLCLKQPPLALRDCAHGAMAKRQTPLFVGRGLIVSYLFADDRALYQLQLGNRIVRCRPQQGQRPPQGPCPRAAELRWADRGPVAGAPLGLGTWERRPQPQLSQKTAGDSDMARFDFDLSCKQWPTSGHNRGDVNVPRKGDGYLAEKWRTSGVLCVSAGSGHPSPKGRATASRRGRYKDAYGD